MESDPLGGEVSEPVAVRRLPFAMENLHVGSCVAVRLGTRIVRAIAKPPLAYPKAMMAQMPIFTRQMIWISHRNQIGSVASVKSVKAAIEPCMIPMPLIAASDQHFPSIVLFQLYSTGVHCGKMNDASSTDVIVLKAINAQRKVVHALLRTL